MADISDSEYTPKKRLCVLSDGTWNSPDNPKPSNIVSLAKAIRRVDDAGVQQLVLYDAGVGTSGGADRLFGGAFGDGIDANIEQLYAFLSMNYNADDEIYMFGFSRGAYTVRSLAGMIHKTGLVRRSRLENLPRAYELYRSGTDTEAQKFREENGDRVNIDLMCCFDTVGSLGVPDSIGWLNGLNRGRYEFHNTNLSDCILNAIHVLSIDEDRNLLKPTLMSAHASVKNQLTQKYFWGSHGGVGGSELTEPEAAKITLRFVVDEMKTRELPLAFHMQIIPVYPDPCIEHRITALHVGFMNWFGREARRITRVEDVHRLAIERFQRVTIWRPGALKRIAQQVLAMTISARNEE